MKTHSHALQLFARKLAVLLIARRTIAWSTVWFFTWGVVVLACRIFGVLTLTQLLFGLLGVVPIALAAALVEYRRRPGRVQVRAAYDGCNHCGGIVMAETEAAAEMGAWHNVLPQAAVPELRWRSGRAFGLLSASAVFVTVALCLPERLAALTGTQPLQIGKLVGELEAEVQLLKEENIIEPKKAEQVQDQLDRIRKEASAVDPARTWEALDHLKEANSDLARQAAEEALTKTARLTEAETLAQAMKMAADSGMGEDTATRAAKDLAAMVAAAKIDEGLLNGKIPAELLAQLDGMNSEDLEKLLNSLQFNKNNFGRTLTNLANLKMIDLKNLAECKNAGQCLNPGALAGFLCNSTNACDSFAALAASYCRGGVDRGRGDAPMTWKEASSDEGAKFKEEALPPSARLSDSQFVGVSRTAPELSGEDVAIEHGALASAQSSGGSAHSQVILPRHKQTVQRFFKREE